MPAKKKPFVLAEFLSQPASELDTGGREQIEYISLDLLDSDERNFYELSGIETLAANIELVGLMDPLRVRPAEGGRFTIVSGHRRRAALQLLADEGKTVFAQVPCIRERGEVSSAMQELCLIYANSDTRKLSPADISRQAERVEELLYKLKDEGIEFPGRMRDHVAQACKVSESKLARLKVIREQLIPELRLDWERGELSESVAYAFARRPADIQDQVLRACKKNEVDMVEWAVNARLEIVEEKRELKCDKSGTGGCTHIEVMLNKKKTNSYSPCEHNKCCKSCMNFETCKDVCPQLAEKQRKLKAKQREKREKEERERPDLENLRDLWYRFGYARQQAGKSVEEFKKAADMYYSQGDDKKYEELEDGWADMTIHTTLPYDYFMRIDSAIRLQATAKFLNCSLDYLFGLSDDLHGAVSESDTSSPWRPLNLLNMPENGQRVVVAGVCDGLPVYSTREWRQPNAFEQEVYRFWLPLPELPKEGEDAT